MTVHFRFTAPFSAITYISTSTYFHDTIRGTPWNSGTWSHETERYRCIYSLYSTSVVWLVRLNRDDPVYNSPRHQNIAIPDCSSRVADAHTEPFSSFSPSQTPRPQPNPLMPHKQRKRHTHPRVFSSISLLSSSPCLSSNRTKSTIPLRAQRSTPMQARQAYSEPIQS